MSYQVIARKWRPQTFDQIVGQEHVTTTLRNSIEGGRVHHAYLFTGIRGCGKTTAARVLAKALNCERGPTAEPCNQCSACTEITNGSSMDVKEVDGASNRGIDSIRELREGVAFAPARDRYKVYIIDEVHMLTTEAFNALLKTLEEPPPHVVFIFATTELHKVPATIASRCQVFEFRRIAMPALTRHLGGIATAEGITASEDALRLIAREADGSLRDACSLLDQVISFAGQDIQVEAVTEILRTGNRGVQERLLAAVLGEDPAGALRGFQEALDRGMPPRQTLRDLARFLGECMKVSLLGGAAARETGLTDAEVAGMAQLVAGRSPESLAVLLGLLVNAADKAADSRSPELLALAALVKAARISALASIEGLVARLEAMASGVPAGGGGTPAGAGGPARAYSPPPPQPRTYATPTPSAPPPGFRTPGSVTVPRGGPGVAPEKKDSAVASLERLNQAIATGGTEPAPVPTASRPVVAPPPASRSGRTKAEVADTLMKHPVVEKVLATFGGDVLEIRAE